MNIKTFLILTFICFSFWACDLTEVQEPQDIELTEKAAQLIKAENEFGLEIFQRIYNSEKEQQNIMVSPLSISLALAMTYNGANGETKTAMEKTLKVYGLSPEDINQSYFDLVNALKSLDEKVLLEIANAIFYRQGFTVENDFITTNKDYYDAAVEELDFSSPNALKTINGWVAQKTHDKIESILDRITPDNVMFLLNAIYFKGEWKVKFKEKDTKKLPFIFDDGNTHDVSTMQKTDEVPYFANDLFQAVNLTYGHGNYSMNIFLPKEGKKVGDIVNELNQATWTDWMNNFGDTVFVDIKLPKLNYKYEIKLNDVLADMGMKIAFDPFNADFTGINKAGGLYIDYVKHKTFIEVNEKGTEAAAVTVVAISKESAPQHIQFTVNRPFLYAITEKSTGAILFIGTVKNP